MQTDSICKRQAEGFGLPIPPPVLYRYKCNTYTGAKDALNIVEAWIRGKKEEIVTDESKFHTSTTINEVHSAFSH